MSRPHISVENALHEYYKLKDLYDEKFDIKKSSVLSDVTLSIQQKRTDIAKFKRARKCIVCKQTGGTIFTDVDRTLKAVCGCVATPCGLNIEIAKGKIENIGELMAATYSKIEDVKDNIIKYKLDLLFRYITDEQLVQKFGAAKKELDTYLEQYDKLYNKYIDITVKCCEKNMIATARTLAQQASSCLLLKKFRKKSIFKTLKNGEKSVVKSEENRGECVYVRRVEYVQRVVIS